MHEPVCALRVRVRGGLNNQRECLINSVLMARQLGLALILPDVDLVGRGNEKFEPVPRPKYAGPWAACGSTTGCQMHLLLQPPSNVSLALMPSQQGKWRQVVLPPVHVAVPGCAGQPRFRDTCTPDLGSSSLFTSLAAAWRQVLVSKAPACQHAHTSRHHALELGNGKATVAATVVFDAGRSLCWNAFKSRDLHACTAFDPICPAITAAALSSAEAVHVEAQRILSGMKALSKGSKGSKGGSVWTALHLRTFSCVDQAGAIDAHQTPDKSGAPSAPLTTPAGPAAASVLGLDGVLPRLLRSHRCAEWVRLRRLCRANRRRAARSQRIAPRSSRQGDVPRNRFSRANSLRGACGHRF